ncbi:hypothetical protein BDF19DRAFT_441631 [Syncephalis fuscata]|nr:hypothetical protein BDF19DRAFT_441631 [Syncephalis fuscata]
MHFLSAGLVFASLAASWLAITQVIVVSALEITDIPIAPNNHALFDVNDNGLLRVYPCLGLMGTPSSVKAYTILRHRPYEFKFTDYDENGVITRKGCAQVIHHYLATGKPRSIEIRMGDKMESIVIKRNQNAVNRSWAETTVLKPDEFIDNIYLEREKNSGIIVASV